MRMAVLLCAPWGRKHGAGLADEQPLRARGALGTTSAWYFHGAFHGVSGAAYVDNLDNQPDPTAVSRGLGGHFQ